MAEFVIMLSFDWRIVVRLSIVQFIGIVRIGKRWLSVICLTGVVVDNLFEQWSDPMKPLCMTPYLVVSTLR